MTSGYSKLLDTSSELLIYRHGGGIKLVRSEEQGRQKDSLNSYYTGHTVGSCLDLQSCIYFGNTENQLQMVNEPDAAALNCQAAKSAIGKTVHHFLERKNAERIRQHDVETLLANRTIISEEVVVWRNNIQRDVIIVKSPWYDSDNKTIGVFACSLLVGMQSITTFLSELSQLSLLSQMHVPFISGKPVLGSQIDGVYLSTRETEVLKQAALGKSARVVGAILGISQRTVESHLENIKMKLNVYSKSELIDKAVHAFYDK